MAITTRSIGGSLGLGVAPCQRRRRSPRSVERRPWLVLAPPEVAIDVHVREDGLGLAFFASGPRTWRLDGDARARRPHAERLDEWAAFAALYSCTEGTLADCAVIDLRALRSLGTLRSVDLDAGLGCGIDEADRVACTRVSTFSRWGLGPIAIEVGELQRFEGEAQATVHVAEDHACALDIYGIIRCWGANDRCQSDPPPRCGSIATRERSAVVIDEEPVGVDRPQRDLERSSPPQAPRSRAGPWHPDLGGLTRNQFLGLNIFDLYPDGSTAEIRAALAGERSHSTSVQHDILWENWYIPLAGPDEGVDFVAGITLDISDKIKRESELTRQLETIKEQQKAIQELSTPIIEVWDKVLTAPLIGFINSQRADNLMERLLHEVTRTGARFAIIDLTGVDAIDTATASHLLRLLMSIRLLGAEEIITGISSHVAQTMVGLGVELASITTRANLREGLRFCMGKVRERD